MALKLLFMGMFIFDVLEVDKRANWGNAFLVPHQNLEGNTNGNLATAGRALVARISGFFANPFNLAPAFA